MDRKVLMAFQVLRPKSSADTILGDGADTDEVGNSVTNTGVKLWVALIEVIPQNFKWPQILLVAMSCNAYRPLKKICIDL